MKTLYVMLRGVTRARLRVPTRGDVRNTPLWGVCVCVCVCPRTHARLLCTNSAIMALISGYDNRAAETFSYCEAQNVATDVSISTDYS